MGDRGAIVSDFVEEMRQEIERRLRELEPLVVEYHRLEAGRVALERIAEPTGRKPVAAKRSAARTARNTPTSKHQAARKAAKQRQARPRRKVSRTHGRLPGDPGGNPPPSFEMTGDPGGNPRATTGRKAR
jgi:hypothetical protein